MFRLLANGYQVYQTLARQVAFQPETSTVFISQNEPEISRKIFQKPQTKKLLVIMKLLSHTVLHALVLLRTFEWLTETYTMKVKDGLIVTDF